MARRSRHGVTLIELILVLAILGATLALFTPRFSLFFAGRALEEEARRLLGLTRYGASQAISTGAPQELWIDVMNGEYGLSPAPGYEYDEKMPIVFYLDEDIIFDEEYDANEDIFEEEGFSPFAAERANPRDGTARKPAVMFWPDGSIDEYSRLSLTIRHVNEEKVMTISQSEDGLEYYIEDPPENER